jgi:hypothetical protein
MTGQTGIFGSAEELIEDVVAEVLKDRRVCPHVIIGPVVWQDNQGKREWYFMVASGDGGGFFTVKVGFGDDAELADQSRASAFAAFAMRKPIVIHDMDDELVMARWCEVIWPCSKTRTIRAAIEAERREWACAGEVS